MIKVFEENFYDVKDIGKILGFSTETARNLIRQGKIKGRKIGKCWYATEPEIKEYINAQKRPSK